LGLLRLSIRLRGIRLLSRVGLLVLLGGNLGLDLAELGLTRALGPVDDAGADEEGEVHDDEDPEKC
jgi:hypothetical protein